MNPYIALPRVPVIHGRQGFILKKCTGRRVLHLGCVDAGLLHVRLQRGELMHQKLAHVAGELWGVDIDAEGISFLRDQGFDNLAIGDICELERIQGLEDKKFDVIVASEVVEHLLNPGLFLTSVKALMIPEKTELIVTVPNAFRIATLLSLLRGVEYVHPDHNYWFSYHTITNLLRKCGLEISQVRVYSFQTSRILPGRTKRPLDSFDRCDQDEDDLNLSRPSPHLYRQALACLRSFPRRLVGFVLYRTTAFWGDGIIIVARVPEDVC